MTQVYRGSDAWKGWVIILIGAALVLLGYLISENARLREAQNENDNTTGQRLDKDAILAARQADLEAEAERERHAAAQQAAIQAAAEAAERERRVADSLADTTIVAANLLGVGLPCALVLAVGLGTFAVFASIALRISAK